MRVRVRFEKNGIMRYVGHLDLMRFFQKAVKRANLPIRYSEGFNPHQIMSFASPLGVGLTSEGEYMEDKLGSKVKYELDPNDDLSNGDEVTLSWKVKTDSIKKKYGVTILAEDKTFTVADLEEAEAFDPFEDIEVSFTGVDGDGQIDYEIVNERDVYDDFSFSADSTYYLSEGDKVTVTFAPYMNEEDLKEYCAREYGIIPTQVEKEYTVEGLGHYVTDASEVTEASLEDVIADCKEVVEDDANLSNNETITAINYQGIYIMSTGDASDGDEAYLVFEINVDVKNGDSDETDQLTYYTYVELYDLAINTENKCSYRGVYGTTYNRIDFDTLDTTFYYYGFETFIRGRKRL